ncbi:MAG: glycerol-3-phosphate 1-O-acyltransferase PlsY [Anaerovoracaceae bacterium]|jgi:glycerol-3-phosphate acyltransferase PlsY
MSDLSLLTKEEIILWLLGIVIAYFIGNISPSILISRAAGIDIRSKGSGNAGTTNMLRVMGKKAAAATLIIDILKGVIAVLIGRYLGGETLAVICGLAVFIGHIWPVVFGLRGGKGIATGLGLLVTIYPPIGLICLAIAALGFLISRRVSVGALLAAVFLPFLAYYYLPDYVVIFSVMAVIVIIKHRSNIIRLIKGQEPKTGFKK